MWCTSSFLSFPLLSEEVVPPSLVEMSCLLPFSNGYCSPSPSPKIRKLHKSRARLLLKSNNHSARAREIASAIKSPSHNHTKTTSSLPIIKPQQLQNEKKQQTLFKRREVAIILGTLGFFSFGLVDDFVLQSHETTAEASPSPSTCELTEAPSGLAYCDKSVGTGPEAVKGQLIKAHYVGKLENGKVFDSSYNRGKPLTFRVGIGEVIKGWDEGILGGDGVPPMLAGGKRTLKLPPELGYGVRGAGCRGGSCIIPPDSVLFFDVEFIGKG